MINMVWIYYIIAKKRKERAIVQNKKIQNLPVQIKKLYEIVDIMEKEFPGRHFSLDGHLIGSIGEVLASYYYGVTLYEASHPIYDGCIGEKEVQIKITQRKSITISKDTPDWLIVLFLDKSGKVYEVYNGTGHEAMKLTGRLDKYNHYHISIKKLSEINKHSIKPKHKIDAYSVNLEKSN